MEDITSIWFNLWYIMKAGDLLCFMQCPGGVFLKPKQIYSCSKILAVNIINMFGWDWVPRLWGTTTWWNITHIWRVIVRTCPEEYPRFAMIGCCFHFIPAEFLTGKNPSICAVPRARVAEEPDNNWAIDDQHLAGSLDAVSFWKVNSTLCLHDFAITTYLKPLLNSGWILWSLMIVSCSYHVSIMIIMFGWWFGTFVGIWFSSYRGILIPTD